ncbi:hypothetical protein CLV30_11244 [Haloactinopolyspora alba]|uniref:Ribonuclease VapC n=1 Tax=Haloactinopolyspora alba TaxID=648780 RepID=A0A2P8DX68_9ACTN|nr:TA system VapC family ribonuclease toxin [Haloactinopolyspora alba]PSL01805.1 hypothetical protein CLV30_11244 [Haloactinopolyspora alba]
MSESSSAELSYLLDANVLIALAVRDHTAHEAAHRWLAGVGQIALCPITEGALVRFLLREGESAVVAQEAISAIRNMPRCEFWSDNVSYSDLDMKGVYGHRQVTDSYLVGLASERVVGRLATFDRALAVRHSTWCVLVPQS